MHPKNPASSVYFCSASCEIKGKSGATCDVMEILSKKWSPLKSAALQFVTQGADQTQASGEGWALAAARARALRGPFYSTIRQLHSPPRHARDNVGCAFVLDMHCMHAIICISQVEQHSQQRLVASHHHHSLFVDFRRVCQLYMKQCKRKHTMRTLSVTNTGNPAAKQQSKLSQHTCAQTSACHFATDCELRFLNNILNTKKVKSKIFLIFKNFYNLTFFHTFFLK